MSAMHTQPASRFSLFFAFGLVYLFWGSTYLAIDIAVEHIPPALMCGMRFLVAGTLMLAFLALRGKRVLYDPRQTVRMAVVGILLLMGGNLTLSYAEKHIASGLAALIVATTPLWFLVLDSLLLGHHQISIRGKAGLGLGIVGLFVLLWPEWRGATTNLGREQFFACLSLQGGTFCWALGSVLAKKWKSPDVDPFSATAWQMIFAGLSNLLFAFALEDWAHVDWTARGLGATAYLVVCGSWIGYTAYIWLLGHAPTSKVSTYAYVNPVVAVFLGWLILGEPVNAYIAAGSAIVVASVILVTSAQVTQKQLQVEMSIAESGD
jgi:drug/metabolite transporter (DMT)-like permease